MAQAISGFFHTRGEGEAAQNALLANGFSRERVSFVTGETAPHEIPKIGPLESTGTQSEAASDAFVGSMVGMAAGTVAVMLPGIGPLIAIGPLAAAIGGAALGSAAGGIIGWLRDQGVSHEEAEFYAQGVAKGGSLVTVQNVEDDHVSVVREILDKNGAIKVEDLGNPEDLKKAS